MGLNRRHIALTGVLAALASCGGASDEPLAVPEVDPVVMQALNDQLMVDPDLARQNQGNAALTIRFDHSLPAIDAGPATIAKIRDEARLRLLEGGEILDLPEPEEAEGPFPIAGIRGVDLRARKAPFAKSCAGDLGRSAIWAARLPDFAELPPRAAVMEAAGLDSRACDFRIVTYRTPMGLNEALHFHFNVLDRAKMRPSLEEFAENSFVISGRAKKRRIVIYGRAAASGLSEFDVITLETS